MARRFIMGRRVNIVRKYNIQHNHVFREYDHANIFAFSIVHRNHSEKWQLIGALKRVEMFDLVCFALDDLYIKKPSNFEAILEKFSEYDSDGDFEDYSDEIVDYLYKHHSVKL